jgi:hypothetical protein
MEDISKQLESVRRRWESLPDNPEAKASFLMHLNSLARFMNEPMDYTEDIDVEFPETIHIACVVCHPECGIKEFIVDGSSQECQVCGGLSFRTETAEYRYVRRV